MRDLAILIVLASTLACGLRGQHTTINGVPKQAIQIAGGPTLPLPCKIRDLWLKSGTSPGLYACTVAGTTLVPGTWTLQVGAGAQGIQGVPGATGPQGPQGATGATGANSTVPGPTGAQGIQGVQGAAGAPGAASTVPGPTGAQGAQGTTGPAGPPGADSTVPGPTGNTGLQGIQGVSGPQGAAGSAATVSAGSTTTGAPGSSASVSNSGTSAAAVFDFTIPRGADGATSFGALTGAATDAQIPDTITIDNLTQVTTRPYSALTGLPTLPANTTATGSQYFSAYNSTTGAFTKAAVNFTDLVGAALDGQIPAGIARLANPTFTTAINILSTSPMMILRNSVATKTGAGLDTGTTAGRQWLFSAGVPNDTNTAFAITEYTDGTFVAVRQMWVKGGRSLLNTTTDDGVNALQVAGSIKSTSTINAVGGFLQNGTALVFPANTTATASQYFSAYNSTTGAFTKATIAAGDLAAIPDQSFLANMSGTSAAPSVSSLASIRTVLAIPVFFLVYAGIDFGSVVDGSCIAAPGTVTVTGASAVDFVTVGLPASTPTGIVITAGVTAANTVLVQACNYTGATVDLPNATYGLRASH